MPRKVAFSAKQKRQQLQDKRALKRGEIEISDFRVTNKYYTPKSKSHLKSSQDGNSKRLYSSFIALTPEYIENTTNLAFSVPLERPIKGNKGVWNPECMGNGGEGEKLRCPERPKYKVGGSKLEVERNEEGVFRKWLVETTGIVERWVQGNSTATSSEDQEGQENPDGVLEPQEQVEEEETEWPRSPSWFETNLEVWRQLWRVSESSHILLLLLDSRCPPIHTPHSLKRYIQNLKPHKEVILVLTKSDLVVPIALEGWKIWCKDYWGEEVGVVAVKSYDIDILQSSGKHRPEIPLGDLEDLVNAIKVAHKRLIEPPEWAKADPEKLASWKPAMRKELDWGLFTFGTASSLNQPESQAQLSSQQPSPQSPQQEQQQPPNTEGDHNPSIEPLTLGLIGQPNVGKSSLLNALLGEIRVRASKTPGKTKHCQTMYWGYKKHIKIVDCPGLVCPSLVGLEIQALAGILPISQIPSLPACIYYASTLLPLEIIFKIPSPPDKEIDPYAHKKTWRVNKDVVLEVEEKEEKEEREKWTAGWIMDGRATAKGYITAKSARPDTNRAGNGIMRSLAEGQIRWCFWPPGSERPDGPGIWLGDGSEDDVTDTEDVWEHSSTEGLDERFGLPEQEEEEEEEESEEDEHTLQQAKSFFAALDMEDQDDSEESEES